jgi:hypothetical protein
MTAPSGGAGGGVLGGEQNLVKHSTSSGTDEVRDLGAFMDCRGAFQSTRLQQNYMPYRLIVFKLQDVHLGRHL